jgi:hypothetical protein
VSSAILANPVSVTHQGVSSYMLTLRPTRLIYLGVDPATGVALDPNAELESSKAMWSLHFDDAYPAAISRVALTGNFSTLHRAFKLASRGRQ